MIRDGHSGSGQDAPLKVIRETKGERDERQLQLAELVEGYREFHDFAARELALIEPLRALRQLHYAAWIARRWDDPAFPAAFPWFAGPRY